MSAIGTEPIGALSEKRRFNRISVNFRFWHTDDLRFERIAEDSTANLCKNRMSDTHL